jgi:hypothetical protein
MQKRRPSVRIKYEPIIYVLLQDAVSHVNISLMTSANVWWAKFMPHHTTCGDPSCFHYNEKFEIRKQSRIRFPYPSHHRHTNLPVSDNWSPPHHFRINVYIWSISLGDNLDLPIAVALVLRVETPIRNYTPDIASLSLKTGASDTSIGSDVYRYTACRQLATVDWSYIR